MQYTEAAQPHPQRHPARSRSARCVAFACQHSDDCAAITADAFGHPGYLSVAPRDVGARKLLSFLHFPAWPRQESAKMDSRWPGRYRCLEEGALGPHLEMQAGGCDCLAWLVRSVPHSLPRNLPTHDLSRPSFASPALAPASTVGVSPTPRWPLNYLPNKSTPKRPNSVQSLTRAARQSMHETPSTAYQHSTSPS